MNRHALGVMLPGFPGTSVPTWLAEALREGLAGVCLFAENTPDIPTTRALTDSIREHAGPRPVVIASDEEGGDVTRIEARYGSSLPGNAALGLVNDTSLTRSIANTYGLLIGLAGINLALGPVLDVASEPLNPVIGVRSFGPDVDVVSNQGYAFAYGLSSAGIAACGKHFPGHGSTKEDSHLALPVLHDPLEVLRKRDMAPFRSVRPEAIMTGHVVVPELGPDPATLSKWAYLGIRASGFEGVIMTDALGMNAITESMGIGEAAVRALEAGADLLCLDSPRERDAETTFHQVHAAIVAAIDSGRLDIERLERSAARNTALADRPVPRLRTTPEEVMANLYELGVRAARQSLITRGSLIVERPWVLLDLRRRIKYASGRNSTAFADRLLEMIPDGEVVAPGDADEARAAMDDEHDVLVLTREPLADTAEGELLAAVLAERPDAIVLHAGVAAAAPAAERLVCCHGVGRANGTAVAELLRGLG